jgi:hypothetical protein
MRIMMINPLERIMNEKLRHDIGRALEDIYAAGILLEFKRGHLLITHSTECLEKAEQENPDCSCSCDPYVKIEIAPE